MPVEPAEEVATMSVAAPYPVRAMWALSWPLMGCVLLAAFLVGMFFPVMGLPLLILTPVAVAAAFWLAARHARTVRLDINRDAVRVTNDRTALTTPRQEVASALWVESFHRGPLLPDTTDVFLLDKAGRSLLMLNGLLWPPAMLDRALDVLGPPPVERVPGRQTGATLTARHPALVRRADGRLASWGRSRPVLLAVLGVLLVAAAAVTVRMLAG